MTSISSAASVAKRTAISVSSLSDCARVGVGKDVIGVEDCATGRSSMAAKARRIARSCSVSSFSSGGNGVSSISGHLYLLDDVGEERGNIQDDGVVIYSLDILLVSVL